MYVFSFSITKNRFFSSSPPKTIISWSIQTAAAPTVFQGKVQVIFSQWSESFQTHAERLSFTIPPNKKINPEYEQAAGDSK